jgi:hypothetical protein
MTTGPDPHGDFSLDDRESVPRDTSSPRAPSGGESRSAADVVTTAYEADVSAGAASDDQADEPTDIEGVTPLSVRARTERE